MSDCWVGSAAAAGYDTALRNRPERTSVLIGAAVLSCHLSVNEGRATLRLIPTRGHLRSICDHGVLVLAWVGCGAMLLAVGGLIGAEAVGEHKWWILGEWGLLAVGFAAATAAVALWCGTHGAVSTVSRASRFRRA